MTQWLLYDGECPFCTAYVSLLRIRRNVGPLPLIDARQGGPEVGEARAAGLDLDQGMVLKIGGRLYHGDACIRALTDLSEHDGWLGRLNGWLFRSPARARWLYPILRRGRNLTLRLLGRARIGAS